MYDRPPGLSAADVRGARVVVRRPILAVAGFQRLYPAADTRFVVCSFQYPTTPVATSAPALQK